MDCSLPDSSVHGISQGANTGMGCCFLFQGIFPTQGWDLSLLHLLPWQVDSLPLHHLGNPICVYAHVNIYVLLIVKDVCVIVPTKNDLVF